MATFRNFHLLEIFSLYEGSHLPLDLLLSKYFRSNRALGSKDRKFLGEMVYGIVRWMGLIDYLAPGKSNWESRMETFSSLSPEAHKSDESIPPHRRAPTQRKSRGESRRV